MLKSPNSKSILKNAMVSPEKKQVIFKYQQSQNDIPVKDFKPNPEDAITPFNCTEGSNEQA